MAGEWAGAARGVNEGFRNAALLQEMDLRQHREALDEKRQGQQDKIFDFQLKQAEKTAAEWDYNNNRVVDPKQVVNSISGVSETAKAKIWNDMSQRYGWEEGAKISRKERDEIIKVAGADDNIKSAIGQGRIDFIDEQIAKEPDPAKKAELQAQKISLTNKYFPKPKDENKPRNFEQAYLDKLGPNATPEQLLEAERKFKQAGWKPDKPAAPGTKTPEDKEDEKYRKELMNNRKAALNAIVLHPANYDEDEIKRAQKALGNIGGIMNAEDPDAFDEALANFVSTGAGVNTTFKNRKNAGQPTKAAPSKPSNARPTGIPADARLAPDGFWYSKNPKTGKFIKYM